MPKHNCSQCEAFRIFAAIILTAFATIVSGLIAGAIGAPLSIVCYLAPFGYAILYCSFWFIDVSDKTCSVPLNEQVQAVSEPKKQYKKVVQTRDVVLTQPKRSKVVQQCFEVVQELDGIVKQLHEARIDDAVTHVASVKTAADKLCGVLSDDDKEQRAHEVLLRLTEIKEMVEDYAELVSKSSGRQPFLDAITRMEVETLPNAVAALLESYDILLLPLAIKSDQVQTVRPLEYIAKR